MGGMPTFKIFVSSTNKNSIFPENRVRLATCKVGSPAFLVEFDSI